jgi:O-antigen/teichoic acid export membrane protein
VLVESLPEYERPLPAAAGAVSNLRGTTSRCEKFKRFAGTESVRENLRTKSISGAFFTAAGSGIDFLLRLASTAILARLVIPEYWGLIGMVTAFTAIAEQIRDLGLSTVTVQKREITHEQISNLFWINVFAGVLIALIVCSASPLLAAFFRDPRLIPLTMVIATNFIWGGLIVQHQALLVRQMKLPQTAILNVSATALSVVLAVGLAINHYEYWALVWRDLARHIFLALGVWALCPWVPSMPKKGIDVKSQLSFGFDMTVTHLVGAIIWNLDRILIGKFCGPALLGMYRQGYQLIMGPMEYLYGPIARVSEPALSALQTDPGRYRRYYKKIVLLLSSLNLPIGIFVAIYAREITLLLLGHKWIDATAFLRIFAFVACIRPEMASSGMVQVTCGRSKAYLVINLIRSAALVLFMLVGVRWGAEGVAVAFLMEIIIMSVPALCYSFGHTPVSVSSFFATISRPLMASMGMGITLMLCRAVLWPGNSALASIALGGAIAACTYACVWMSLPGGKDELRGLVADLAAGLGQRRRRPERQAVMASSAP